MNDAGCILGDFNSILYKEDRIGGQEVMKSEITDFAKCIEACKLTEMRCTSPYFS